MLVREWFYGKHDQPVLPMRATKAKSAPPPKIPSLNSRMLERLCIQCSHNQAATGSVFCGPQCGLQARAGAPKLMVLPAAHYMFRTSKASYFWALYILSDPQFRIYSRQTGRIKRLCRPCNTSSSLFPQKNMIECIKRTGMKHSTSVFFYADRRGFMQTWR